MKKGQLRQLVLSLGVGIAVFLVLALGLRWNFLFREFIWAFGFC